ncbi:MAG: protein kinase [archaeon]|nr:protein kinase [archaeon]
MNKEMSLEQLLKAKKISQITYDKVTIAKEYIERKYNLKTLKNMQMNSIAEKLNSLNIPQSDKDRILSEFYQKESQKLRKKREKLTIRDYVSIHIIGRGAFGEVRVCKDKRNEEIVAIKKIRKDVLVVKNQIIHTRNEQQFLSKVKSPWIVDLKASFQEGDYLFLVMEYLPGGDLMNLLIVKDIFTEEEARFYTAELILSVESIHKLDCIHRDIKPDNILIGKDGHIKLSDFGLAKISEKIFDKSGANLETDTKSHKKNFSCVGTANYVAPEVLCKKGYGPEIDWWSVGVIFFEMLCGYAPFCSKETSEVCSKILNWEKFLTIPKKVKLSKEAEDLIFKMVRGYNTRLGKNGADEIKRHPFFKSIDWENIRNTKAPFIPDIQSDSDCKYFEELEEKKDEPFYPIIKHKKRKEVAYIGYTYKNDEDDDDEEDYHEVIETLDSLKNKESASSQGSSNNITGREDNKGSFADSKKSFDSELKEKEKEKSLGSKGSFAGQEKISTESGVNSEEQKKTETKIITNLKETKPQTAEIKSETKAAKKGTPLKKIALNVSGGKPSTVINEKDKSAPGNNSQSTAVSSRAKEKEKAPNRSLKNKLSPVPKRPSALQRLALQLTSKKVSASPTASNKMQNKK